VSDTSLQTQAPVDVVASEDQVSWTQPQFAEVPADFPADIPSDAPADIHADTPADLSAGVSFDAPAGDIPADDPIDLPSEQQHFSAPSEVTSFDSAPVQPEFLPIVEGGQEEVSFQDLSSGFVAAQGEELQFDQVIEQPPQEFEQQSQQADFSGFDGFQQADQPPLNQDPDFTQATHASVGFEQETSQWQPPAFEGHDAQQTAQDFIQPEEQHSETGHFETPHHETGQFDAVPTAFELTDSFSGPIPPQNSFESSQPPAAGLFLSPFLAGSFSLILVLFF